MNTVKSDYWENIVQENLYTGLFKAWLRSFADKTKVGYTCTLCQCPIANYINSIVNADGLCTEVSSLTGKITLKYKDSQEVVLVTPIPVWVEDFVFEVDSQPMATISSQKALEILSGVA